MNAGLVVRTVTHALGGREVLQDISADAAHGRLTAVVGPNAAGKSTLLRTIVGYERLQHGAIELDGTSISDLRGDALAQRVAFVPQRPHVSAAFTVREIVGLGARAGRAALDVVDTVLDAMQLADLQDRLFHELSVGQQQRVSVARALAQVRDRGLLVLDEPTSAMDLQFVERTLRVLRQVAVEREAVVVIAIHDLSVAAAAADAVWLLDQGRLAAAGPAVDVMTPARLAAVFGVAFELIDDGSARPRLAARLDA